MHLKYADMLLISGKKIFSPMQKVKWSQEKRVIFNTVEPISLDKVCVSLCMYIYPFETIPHRLEIVTFSVFLVATGQKTL
jgi:hypothetical protein